MKILFVVPHIGRKTKNEYVRSWQMEPLAFATLAGITPKDVEIVLYDERLEEINFDDPADLVGINTETYTAKRAYEISAEFRKRGVPVVLGGYHTTLAPNEAVQYADSVVVGPAEGAWEQVLKDAESHTLKPTYMRPPNEPMRFSMPRRDIFRGKNYFDMGCVESGRGCPLRCNFCSIAAATNSKFTRRPIKEVVQEIEMMGRKDIFIVDDNIIGNIKTAKELFRALKSLHIRWVSQGTINMVRDDELLTLMVESGCKGVLIGFESFEEETLKLMDKGVNIAIGDYEKAVKKLHSYGLGIYGTFIFGYDTDTLDVIDYTTKRAIDLRIFIAALNHLLPFPGTPLYEEFKKAGKLRYDKWWLSPSFDYNEVPFNPKNFTHEELREACFRARKKFYSASSIVRRSFNPGVLFSSPKMMFVYFMLNFLLGKEVEQKNGLPLGNELSEPTAMREAVYVS